MNRFLSYALYLLLLAGVAWIINWAVPHQEWQLLPKAWASLALVVLAVLSVPLSAVLFHELAHGLAALLTGYRIYSICFWAPTELTHFNIGGIWFAFGNLLRGGGYCIAYPKVLRSRRSLLYPAAGPAMNLILAIAGALAADGTAGWTSHWLAAVALVNALYFGTAMVPKQGWIAGRPALSDGARIYAAFGPLDPAALVELKLEYAWGLVMNGRGAEAELIVAQCLKECPSHEGARTYQAWLHWRGGKTKEALELFETVVTDGANSANAKAALAIVLCNEGPHRNLEWAESLSKEAMLALPRSAYCVMVRGVVLGAQGSGEAHRYFDQAYSTLLDPGERGYTATVRGLYLVAEKRFDQAEHLLRRAIYLGAEKASVKALARAIRQAKKGAEADLTPSTPPI